MSDITDPHRRLVHPMYRAGLQRPRCAPVGRRTSSLTPTLTSRVLSAADLTRDALDEIDDDETYARLTMSRSQMVRIVPRVSAAQRKRTG